MTSFNKVRKSQQKDDDKLHQARLARCIPVARKLLAHIHAQAATIPLGDDVQNSKEYDTLAAELLTILLQENVAWVDREFVFQLALQPLSYAKDIVTSSLQNSWTVVLTGLFGKKVNDLTMTDVDACLRKGDKIDSQSF